MMKLQISNDRDRKEAQNRERSRQCELERRSRIFNARNRKIGVDVPFLERQIQEKREIDAEQKRKDAAFALQMIKDSELAKVLEGREQEERRLMGAAIDEFRLKYQRKEDSREYDLNDPKILTKQLPAREGEKPALASAQKFEGEDDNYKERNRIMAEQRTAWLEQQLEEKKAFEEDRRRADSAYMAAIKARDARAGELDRLERETRYRVMRANMMFNEALAREKKQKEKIERTQEEADNTADVFNHLTSDMLTENPDVAKSSLGGNRAIGFMYKGMNAEELKRFREDQMQQIADQKRKRDEELKMEAEWQALAKSISRQACKADIEEKRHKREVEKQLMEENQLLAMAQREKTKYYSEVLNTNVPTEDFYTQFNTTTR